MNSRVVKWPVSIFALAFITTLMFSGVSDAQVNIADNGGHFRFATMFWQRVDDPNSNTVKITIESAWRRSYSSSYFTPAQTPSGQTVMRINGRQSPVVDFGDGKIQFLESVVITAYSSAEDWFMGVQEFNHTYDTPSNQGAPWVVTFKGCCRLSSLQDQKDTPWNIQTNVNLIQADQSPRIVSLPVIFLQSGTQGNFSLKTSGGPGMDLSAVTWSLSPPWAGGAAGYAPGGVQLSPTGVVQAQLSCAPAAGLSYCLWYMSAYATLDTSLLPGSGGDGGPVTSPVDMLLNVTIPAVSDPVFGAGMAAAAGATADAPWDWKATLYPGFEYKLDIAGQLASAAAAAVYVGFTVGPLPPGAHLSAVRGKGLSADEPAVMTLRWTPTAGQLGTSVLCLDVVNSLGRAATQRCLLLSVVPDPGPKLSFAYNGVSLALAARPPHQCPTSPCYYALAYMGRVQTLAVVASDDNAQDAVTVDPVPMPGRSCNGTAAGVAAAGCGPLLPPGATLGQPAAAVSAGGLAVTRVLTITPAFNDGGALVPACFQAADGCGVAPAGARGAEKCPGVVQTDVACVWVQVMRCSFVVQQGQQLQEVAAIYGTDWLQLWALNLNILHPDMDLDQGMTLSLGHEYAVQPFETAAAVAKRFGMSSSAFAALNADLGAPGGLDRAVCGSVAECQALWWCVLPNSCAGASQSIYAAAAGAGA